MSKAAEDVFDTFTGMTKDVVGLATMLVGIGIMVIAVPIVTQASKLLPLLFTGKSVTVQTTPTANTVPAPQIPLKTTTGR